MDRDVRGIIETLVDYKLILLFTGTEKIRTTEIKRLVCNRLNPIRHFRPVSGSPFLHLPLETHYSFLSSSRLLLRNVKERERGIIKATSISNFFVLPYFLKNKKGRRDCRETQSKLEPSSVSFSLFLIPRKKYFHVSVTGYFRSLLSFFPLF